MKPFYIASDVNGQPTYSVPFSDFINVHNLSANTAETVTLPTGARFAVFSSTSDFYARSNATASIPTGDISDGSGSEMNPNIRCIEGVTSLSIISPMSCMVSIAFYG